MARQEGSQRIIGRIGNLIYYKRKGVYVVRMASTPPTKKQMQEDPVFIKTRQLNREFGAAAKAGHDFRAALVPILLGILTLGLYLYWLPLWQLIFSLG